MKIFKRILLLGILVTSTNAFGAPYSWAPEGETVDRYYPVVGTVVYVHMNGVMHNPAGCSSSYYYAMRSTHPEFEEYKKLILTAKSAGLKLRIAIVKDANDCDGAYPKIERMYLY